MRKLLLLALLGAMVVPAGAKPVTVAELEQFLAANTSAKRADLDVSRKMADLELTERLTDATLIHLGTKLELGPKTALALHLLADQSALLDPPANELPATAAPDSAAQQRIMDLARGYVVQAFPHLPDFFATRTTYRFDNSPQVLTENAWPVHAGLHLVGASSQDVAFRDGKEVIDAQVSANGTKPGVEPGPHLQGEFGPELAVVIIDASKGEVTWSHWEQTSLGLAAVFHYSVPKDASHYSISHCCVRDLATNISGGGRGRRGGGSRPVTDQTESTVFHATPGYHGSISISPASGAILRITIEADLKIGDPLKRAAHMLQYGPVVLGDKPALCPLRGMTLEVEQVLQMGVPPNTQLAETTYTHYHRLATTVRVLADAASPAAAHPVDMASSTAAPAVSATPAATPPTPPTQQMGANAASSAVLAEQAPAQAAQAPATIPEISSGPSGELPDEPGTSSAAGARFKLSSRLVDVSIVATDKKGHPVTDLTAQDFEVYDNGRKQEIRSFVPVAAQSAASPVPAPSGTFSNRPVEPAAATPGTAASESGATVLLIDESHIAWRDMSRARQQMLDFLNHAGSEERIGLYSITPLGFRVLQEVSTDHAATVARLQKWTATAQSVSMAQGEEARNRQQIDEVRNVSDLNAVNGNQDSSPDAMSAVDPQLRALGDNPARASLIVLRGVARHLAALPGHKSLVWVSSDNVFADWQNKTAGTDRGPQDNEGFAIKAQEAMNDAHVAVYPMDVSQLETGAIDAEMQHRNVELTQSAADMASLGRAGGDRGASATNLNAGRSTDQMQQDIRPIQASIRQVADATGGHTIRRAGDLAAELAKVVEDGHATYQITFTPPGPADDQYHNLTVKFVGKQHGVALRYRTGFLFDTEPSTLKDRFQQAIWRPRDPNEISLTANVTPIDQQGKSGANVKVKIRATDLALQQQADRWMDKLDIFFIQRDDAAVHAQVDGQTIGLRLLTTTYQKLLTDGIPVEQAVQMKPGMASLRVLVVDENSGRMGSVTIPGTALGGR